jgi:8-amino-7-oxononanoate synthase
LRRAVVAQVHTFGKALGGHGAVVVCDEITREYLANYAQPFVYATAPPDSHSRLARRAYEAVAAADDARRHVARLIDLFRAECDVGSLLLPSRTPIQAVLAPGADVALRAADRVRSKGFDVRAIRAPTVAAGAERLRLVLHAFNTEAEVLGVARAVREAVDASSSSSSEERRLVG